MHRVYFLLVNHISIASLNMIRPHQTRESLLHEFYSLSDCLGYEMRAQKSEAGFGWDSQNAI